MQATQENQNKTELVTFDLKSRNIQGQIHKLSYQRYRFCSRFQNLNKKIIALRFGKICQ